MSQKYPRMADFLKANQGNPGCWVYPSARDAAGYALYKEKGVKAKRAHRAAHEVIRGQEVPSSEHILHRCDNPPCANPGHHFSGTPKDNYEDAKAKDRHSRGERNGCSKLTESQVRAIRADSRTQMRIATDYGIRQTTVSEIKRRNRWAHI